VAHLKKN